METREEGDDVQSGGDLLQRWLTALRSGKYSQAREALKKGDSFCCLGVLCDVANPTAWVEDYWESGDMQSEGNDRPPIELIEQVGLRDGDMEVLIELNDGDREDFAHIADIIEEMIKTHKERKDA